jgi:hypothetical protein
MTENIDPTKSYFQTIKTSLRSVVKNPVVIEKLTDAALLTSRIMTHTLQFMKLYFIHCYDNGQPIPKIDRPFVTAIMKTLCEAPASGRPPKAETVQLKAHLAEFHSEHYQPIMQDTLNYKHLNTVLDYMSTDIETMYENNIKQRFCSYVERFVNVSLQKRERIEAIKESDLTAEQKKEQTNILCRELRKVKNDILCANDPKTSDEQYHVWIDEESVRIMPQRELREDSVYYDIQCNPQDYLPLMVYMMKAVEATGNTISGVFPLRSQLIPKHFRLDTTSLVYLLFTNENGKRTNTTLGGNLKRKQSDVWGQFFKTDMKCFHRVKDNHDYTFHHMIETDGVSCSILLIRKDKAGKIVKQPKAKKGGGEQYIDELSDDEREELVDLKLVAIDPNMGDLLYCVDSDQRDQTKFRYSQDMRRKETKFKKYRDLLQTQKRELIDGRRVVDWETDMSAYNKKTLNFEAFKTYIKHKNALNLKLAPFYNKYIFRKLKLGSYSRRQITEARMLKRFEKLFGPPDKVVICIGDWEQRQHRRFKEPVKGKGFRKLFRRAGYRLYLGDEFRTSCKCSACSSSEHGVCSTFRMVDNPKPYREGRILRHGLVKCQTCSRLWNRDTNASSNIWKVAKNAILGLPRPAYLQRAH